MTTSESAPFSIGVKLPGDEQPVPVKTMIRKFRSEETGELIVLEMDETGKVIKQL